MHQQTAAGNSWKNRPGKIEKVFGVKEAAKPAISTFTVPEGHGAPEVGPAESKEDEQTGAALL